MKKEGFKLNDGEVFDKEHFTVIYIIAEANEKKKQRAVFAKVGIISSTYSTTILHGCSQGL